MSKYQALKNGFIIQYRYNGNNNDENCKSLSPFEGLGFAIHINIIKYNEHAT